jgi:hypothetical protein
MTNGITYMVEVQSKNNYNLLLANGGILAVSNYMFRPLYRPSSGNYTVYPVFATDDEISFAIACNMNSS